MSNCAQQLPQVSQLPSVDFNEINQMDNENSSEAPPTNENNQQGQTLGVDMPPTDLVTKIKRKASILRYKTLFPNALAGYEEKLGIEYLDKLTSTQIEQLYQEIRIHIGTRNSSNLIPLAYKSLASIPEALGPSFGFELQGLQTQLILNEQIKDQLNEISMEYENACYIHPIYRLALTTIGVMSFVHQDNSMKRKMREISEINVKQDIIDEFQDL